MDSYNFDKIGKKMPYRVPDNFFSDVEDRILSDIASRCPQSSRRMKGLVRILYRSVAVAATLALLLVATDTAVGKHTPDFAEIASAFDNLPDSDQTYLLETYQEDIFINE